MENTLRTKAIRHVIEKDLHPGGVEYELHENRNHKNKICEHGKPQATSWCKEHDISKQHTCKRFSSKAKLVAPTLEKLMLPCYTGTPNHAFEACTNSLTPYNTPTPPIPSRRPGRPLHQKPRKPWPFAIPTGLPWLAATGREPDTHDPKALCHSL